MTAIDWTPIIQAVMTALVAVIGAVAAWAVAEFRARTAVLVTDQQRAAVYSAAQTGAGLLKTKLDQGLLLVSDITPTSPAVIAQAQTLMAHVPDSAAAQGTTVQAAAAIIAGRVNTTPKA